MANIASVSQSQLTNRRKQLQRERQIRLFQTIWRSLVVGGMAGGLVWAITLPDWVIGQPEQIVIEGNELLSSQAIRSLLPLSYPEYLLQVEPQALAKSLKSQAPIAEAKVIRQLMPPGLTIQIKELKPVAIAQPSESPQKLRNEKPPSERGFLDAEGNWIPESSLLSLKPNFKLPTLKVIGSKEQYHNNWPKLYQEVSTSIVEVLEIDWQDPLNLILKTELGHVHCGSDSSRFSDQLAVLARLQELSTQIKPSQIAYIDLKNPDLPVIQLKKINATIQPENN